MKKCISVFLNILTFQFLFNLTLQQEREKRISDVNVLLPICESTNCNKISYSVHAEGGCYEWSVDKPGFIDLEQVAGKHEKGGCKHKVNISPTTSKSSEVVWLIAKEVSSGELFKCKVGFAKIDHLRIEKRFDRMNVGDIAEIKVNGYDVLDNMFSSLEGFRFHWKIKEGGQSVEMLKLSQEKREISPRRYEVEKKHYSDMILLKGLNTGRIIVTAQLSEEEYSEIISKERNLYVVDPFVILPESPLYILPNNRFDFDILLTIQNKRVALSDQKYYTWSIEQCGGVEGYGKYTSHDGICNTEIIAKDTRIDQFNSAQSFIHVVHATSLDIGLMELSEQESMHILSDKNFVVKFEEENSRRFTYTSKWKLVEGKSYLVKSSLMFEGHPIYYSEGYVKYELSFKDLTKRHIISMNCFSEMELCLIKTGVPSEDYFPLESNSKSESEPHQRAVKSVRVYPKVRIEKFGQKNFKLPYLGYREGINENILRSQELRLLVTGGTGSYYFETSSDDVISVNELVLYGKNVGKANVKVVDSEIESNFDTVEIFVLEMKDVIYLEERQEIELGGEFYVNPIGIKDFVSDNDPYGLTFHLENSFTNCTDLILEPTLSSKDKEIPQIEDIGSNYRKIRNFLKTNKNALIHKLKFYQLTDENTDFVRYLKYSNFGICDSRGFKGENEGLIKLSFSANVMVKGSHNKLISNKINPPTNAKIYVYSPLSLTNPKFEDIFTIELLHKASIADPHKQRTFILAPHAGMTVKLGGGVIPWADYTKDYQENKHILDSAKNRTFSIDEVKKDIKLISPYNKELYVECQNLKAEHEVVMIASNAPHKTLIRPGRSQISFTVGCGHPKHLSIFFLGRNNLDGSFLQSSLIKENDYNEVFNVPQKEGIEYYEKKNNIEISRVYAFDENLRIFYNITTLHGEWSAKQSGSEKLFSVMTQKDYAKHLEDLTKESDKPFSSSILDVQFKNPEYVHNAILFSDQIKRFDLYYNLKENLLPHYVKINLIDFPVLEPFNSTLFLSNDNKIVIDILYGSGDFEISLSDATLASYHYDKIERKIHILPLKQGVLLVNVKDLKINNHFVVSSVVYISDIKKILLFGGGYLMVNNTMNITMKVIDNYDRVFPLEQVKKMSLNFVDKTYIEGGLHVTLPDSGVLYNNFTIRGLLADYYTIVVFDKTSNVTSNAVKIEVFDKLEVFPPYLLMVPGSSFTLSIRGGPVNEENVIKRFEMIDNKIASVDGGYPEVNAHLIGNTILKITLSVRFDYNKFYQEQEHIAEMNKTEVLVVQEVPVRVDFPETVEIIGASSRKIFTKSTVRLLAAFKKNEEIFTYATGPFKFEWAIDNTLVAKIRYYTQKKEECASNSKGSCSVAIHDHNYNPHNSIGVFMKTSDQGSIEVKLIVTITYPDPYTWRRPYTFVKSEKVLISDEIYVDIPEFYENDPNKSSLYLIPLDIEHELHTNKNSIFKYSLITQIHKDNVNPECTDPNEKNVITLSETGRVATHHKRGMAYVMITRIKENEKDKAPFVPVVLPIMVTDFYSLFIERSHQVIEMESGQEISLKVILQHEYGLLFAERFERLSLAVVESHPKVAKCELLNFNSKLKIKANSKGYTNVIIFNPTTKKIYDVFQIQVYSNVILPERLLINLGGQIDFLKKDLSRKLLLSQDSEWISDDPSIVRIDPVDGVAVGIREGITKVHLVSRDKTKVKLSTFVRVGKVKHVEIDRTKLPKIFTDIKSSTYYKAEYRIPFKFYIDETGNEEFTTDSLDIINAIDQKLNFKCVSNQPEIFIAEGDANTHNSEFKECLIRIRDYTYDSNVPSNLELKIIAEAKSDKKEEKYIFESITKLPFTSAFKIKNNIKEITFSRSNRTNFIHIDNIKDLVVEVQDESVVKVEEDVDNKYIKLYVPYNVTTDFKDVKLAVRNKLTDQKEEVLLSYIHEKEEEPARIFYGLIKRSTFIDFLTLILLVAIIYILYSYLTMNEEPKPIGPTTPNRPMGSGITQGTLNMNRY